MSQSNLVLLGCGVGIFLFLALLSRLKNHINYKKAYQKRYLVSKHEKEAYRTLRYGLQGYGLTVCPKVRLLDLVEPIHGHRKYRTLLYKVQSKHVDFTVCDSNLNVVAIVELDDSSHDAKDRQQRDQFVDLILKSVGYTVIHTRNITDSDIQQILRLR